MSKLIPVSIRSDGEVAISSLSQRAVWSEEDLIDFYASRGTHLEDGRCARVVLIRARGPRDALTKALSVAVSHPVQPTLF
jgi:hypothetical protein